jgi:mono/diheme cytochrome c family protein
MKAHAIVFALVLVAPSAALADANGLTDSVVAFTLDGKTIYENNCQACHMADAKGSHVVVRVPALAKNSNLMGADYPIVTVLEGRGAMPWFNGALTPAQIASLVGYVRTHFGNHYTAKVTEADVKRLAKPVPKESQ